MNKFFIALAVIFVSILVFGYIYNLNIPYSIGDIDMALIEVCEDEDTIFLPVKWGEFNANEEMLSIEFFENNTKVAEGKPKIIAFNRKFGFSSGELKLTIKLTSISREKLNVNKIHIIYINKTVEYKVNNFTIINRKIKFSDILQDYVYPDILLGKENDSAIVFRASSESKDYTVNDLGVIGRYVSDNILPSTVAIDNKLSIPITLQKHDRKFQLLKAIVETNKGYLSCYNYIPIGTEYKYVKGKTVRRVK